jgi:hypothetical protein
MGGHVVAFNTSLEAPRTNCLRGWGCSNLWSDFLSDRWSSSICKKFEFNRKSPTEYGTPILAVPWPAPSYFT